MCTEVIPREETERLRGLEAILSVCNRLLEARARELARRAAAVQRHGGARTRRKQHVRRLEAVAASRREQANPAAAREQFSLVGVGR